MNRSKRRLATAMLAVMVATLALVSISAPVSASGTGTLSWTGSYWRDPNCGTGAQQFEVRLYRDVSYGGTEYRLCGPFANFCNSPYGVDSAQASSCHLGIPANGTLNDIVSSVKVISVGGGASCRVRIHEHAYYGGVALTYWDPVNVASLVPWPNDQLSSIRRVC